MTDQDTSPEDTLESLIDKHGLKEVLDFLVCVCAKKAAHLRENWQDEGQGKAWSSAAQTLLKAENRIPRAINF